MNTNKIPPQAIDAERTVLASCMVSVNALEITVELLNPDSFYRTAHRQIFICAQNLFNLEIPVDIISLSEELRRKEWIDSAGGEVYLSELIENVSTTRNITKHCELLIEKERLRALISISSKIMDRSYDPAANYENIITELDVKLSEITCKDKKYETIHIKEIASKAFKEIERAKEGKQSGITTGYRVIDEKMGQFQNGDLIILAARPSMGKTALMVNMAYNAAAIANTPILIFSLEMTGTKLFNRIASAESGINSRDIRHGRLDVSQLNKLGVSSGEIVEKDIYINENPNLNIYQIRTICNRMKRKYDIGLVMIDYLQFIQDTGLKENKTQETGEKSRVGKQIAKDLNIPVVELSQLSRAVEGRNNKRPMLSDLRESGNIEQDADVVMFIYRPYVAKDSEDPTETEIIIAKNREGDCGTIKQIEFIKENTLFRQKQEYDVDF